MTDEEKVTEKKTKMQPGNNMKRLKDIKKKRTQGISMKYMAMAGVAVAVVTSVAIAGGVLAKGREAGGSSMKVETVAASLETTALQETEAAEPKSIVLETTLSNEEIAEREHDEAVQKVLEIGRAHV